MENLADLSWNWPDGDLSAGHLRIHRRCGYHLPPSGAAFFGTAICATLRFLH